MLVCCILGGCCCCGKGGREGGLSEPTNPVICELLFSNLLLSAHASLGLAECLRLEFFVGGEGEKKELDQQHLSLFVFLFLYPSLSSSMRRNNNDGNNNTVRGRKEAREWKACYYNNNALLACLPPGILPEARLVCTGMQTQCNATEQNACPPACLSARPILEGEGEKMK